MKKLVLFGDSLFGQLGKHLIVELEAKLSGEYDVYNCAAGGWDSNDLVNKSSYIAQLKPDVLLLSVGTNDASHWKQVELQAFKINLRAIIDNFKDSRIIFFLPPPVNEAWQPPEKRLSQETMKQYYDAGKAVCDDNNIEYIKSWDIFMSLIEPDDSFHVSDGVHLSDKGYDALFSAFAEVINEN